MSSIGGALELARGTGKEVWVCSTEGPYHETLSLRGRDRGLVLRGGLDCDGYGAIRMPTEVVARDPFGHRIQATSEIALSGFLLRAPDASGEGQSSVGLWIVRSESIHLSAMEIRAGRGGPGRTGESPGGQGEPGASGNGGQDACVVTTGPNLGGAEVVTSCGSEPTTSLGATGGPAAGAGIATAGDGGSGGPRSTGGPGGTGEDSASCRDGENGAPGLAGEDGAGSAAFGNMLETGYQPPLGSSGTTGEVGGGGGGGGGAKKPESCTTGASGGGGGGGGCPGQGAGAGSGGGGSFAVVSLDSTLELDSVQLTVSEGGSGGVGGDGQAGGPGGDPGPAGEAGAELTASDACAGGKGGRGGRGGSGGGGAGGPQLGLTYRGPEPVTTDVETRLPPEGAPGGDGGQLNQEVGRGPTGLNLESFLLP